MILLMLASPLSGKAQTRAEWTQQKATQLKYLYQQLAALQVYAGHLKEGYDIARKGWQTMRHIRRGEWREHENFFEALIIVRPTVKTHPAVAGTLTLQQRLLKEAGEVRRQLQQVTLLTKKEKTFIQNICDNLLLESTHDLEALLAITTEGSYRMSDDERIRQMEKLFTAMQEKLVFMQSFSRTVTGLATGKKGDLRDIQLSKHLNAVP